MSAHQSAEVLSYRVTRKVWAALFVFVFVNSAAILQMRGVCDPQGYILNTSKAIPVNTYEDDAQVSIMHALGYFGPTTNTFDVATNFGGPLLHLAKPVMWLGAKLGWIKRFDDRYLYVLYPEELGRVFKLFAFYKLALLTLLPLSAFWLLNNFFSRRAGELAAWLIAGMPFLTGFELRLKPEGVVFALTMLSLLHQFAFARKARPRHLYLAVIFFALSAAMKFTMATAIFILAACFVSGTRRSGRPFMAAATLKLMAGACATGLAVFTLSNPRIVPGMLIFADFIGRYTSLPPDATVSANMLTTIWFRLSHFAPLLGQALGLLAIPALAFACLRSMRRKELVTPWSCLCALFFLQAVFLWKVAHNHVLLDLTYYYYSQSLLMIVIIAVFLDEITVMVKRRFSLAVTAWACIIFVAGYTFTQNMRVLNYLSGPSTRQSAQEWVEEHVPAGSSLGLPIAEGEHLTFNDRFLANPFQHRILPVGLKGEKAETALPDYVLWVQSNPLQPAFMDPKYEAVARFDTGRHLPREAFNFYQDDIYTVYRRATPPPAQRVPGPTDADAALGAAFADEPNVAFNLMQYKALGIFPNDLTLFLHAGDRFTPLSPGLFLSAVRHASSPPAYVHQVPPELMILWGVKYVLARQDQAFRDKAENNPAYALKPLSLATKPGFPDNTRLYQFTSFDGMAHFLPSPPKGSRQVAKPRWFGLLERHKLKTYGELYAPSLARPASGLLRVRMTVDCDGPLDLLLKGGPEPLSIYLGAGRNEVDVPLALAQGGQPGYELNPAASGAACTVQSIEAEPMRIEPAQCWSCSVRHSFATVTATTAGQVLFALPFHPYWKACVDGVDVEAEKGPGDTVAVPVGEGQHLVELHYDGF